jgi:hypothetical protein
MNEKLKKVVNSEEFQDFLYDLIDDGVEIQQMYDDHYYFMIVDSQEQVDKFVDTARKLYKEAGGEDEIFVEDIMVALYGVEYVNQYDCWGFSDEYSICNCCYKVVRTSPDSYSWVQDYWTDCELICGECVRSNPDDYIEYLTNNIRLANTILPDSVLEEKGWEKQEEVYRNGWFDGMNDKPEDVLKKYNAEGYDVIFEMRNSQFYIEFQAWIKKVE